MGCSPTRFGSLPSGKSPTLSYVLTPMPGEVWSHQLATSTLSIIRVAAQPTRAERFVLLLDNRPIMPPFMLLDRAVSYARCEWIPIAHQEIAG